MRRLALVALIVTVGTAAARSEDMWDPPWDPSLDHQTLQEWDFPNLLTAMAYQDGDVLDMPMFPLPGDTENPFGEPYVEWPPVHEIPVENPEDPGEIIILTAKTEVEMVEYVDPDGNPQPGTPTVHVSVTTPDGTGVEGTPLAGVTVPVSIFIPNHPEPNLSKMIFWQMTSDKSPTPTGSPPTAQGVGPDGYTSTDHPSPHPDIQHSGPGNWYSYNGLVEIQPNPEGEWLTFELVDSTNIEEIVVKTVCMPEPATLGLLAMGGVGILLSRRRRV